MPLSSNDFNLLAETISHRLDRFEDEIRPRLNEIAADVAILKSQSKDWRAWRIAHAARSVVFGSGAGGAVYALIEGIKAYLARPH